VSHENVYGVGMDGETRCVHFGTELDVVALRFGCCAEYYCCLSCHRTLADHGAEPWPADRRTEPAVLCGVCGTTMTASEYISAGTCPNCASAFNPGCAKHYDRYFEWIDGTEP
jgi:uncharacterized CHY-type Zn-finger protein